MVRRLLIALALTGLSLPAAAGGPRAKPARAKPQKVQIGKPTRKVVVNQRMMKLRGIRSLPAPRSEVQAGLRRYRAVRHRVRELRQRPGSMMTVKPLAKVGSFVIDRLDFKIPGSAPKPKILIVGGVHAGSERIGVESAMQIAEQLHKHPDILEHFDVTIVPLANPSSLAIRSRRNSSDVDVNRSFAAGKMTPESKAMSKLMKQERFGAVLDLHGAGKFRTGFFFIRGGQDGGLAARTMRVLPKSKLLDNKGAGKVYELDAPGVVTSTNPNTLKHHAIANGAKYAYTVESPKRFSPQVQIAGMVKLSLRAMRNMKGKLSR
ncbi:MAG: succinylglutamate desuccinylase/aspartoacylase family protein [Deltaproteobacteria bacterium]|nr:succinylglutamate desuccinylase/aspartoacylase family protein [Deltaproteobacteria bacterium]